MRRMHGRRKGNPYRVDRKGREIVRWFFGFGGL